MASNPGRSSEILAEPAWDLDNPGLSHGLVPTTTRWQVYQLENAGAKTFTNSSKRKKKAAPQCKDSLPAADLNRRVINVAIVDCDYWSINGGSNELPVTTLMAKFFMTEPAGTPMARSTPN